MNSFNSVANERNGVTGVLYHYEGLFFQTLEGEEETVRSLSEKIFKDDRHKKVVIIGETVIQKRAFPFWTMSYFDRSLAERYPEARLDVLKEQDDFVYGLHKVFLQERARHKAS